MRDCPIIETNKYVYAGSQRVATISSTQGTLYFHGDHLGSTSLMTDSAGSVVRTTQYNPYGSTFSDSGTKDNAHKFTGHILDGNTNLIYMNARYMDPSLGVFITPDTIVQNPYDPQCLNRYSYCRNNPIMYTDPSGHDFGISALIVTIAAIYGGAKEASHNFSCDPWSGKWDWNAGLENAAKWAAVAATVVYGGEYLYNKFSTPGAFPPGASTPAQWVDAGTKTVETWTSPIVNEGMALIFAVGKCLLLMLQLRQYNRKGGWKDGYNGNRS